MSQANKDAEEDELPYPVVPVDPDACVLPDATLCAFAVLEDMLVALAQGPTQWKVQLFEHPCLGEDPQPGGQIGEVELSTYTPQVGIPGKPTVPRFLPVLCCMSLPGSRAPHGHPQACGGFTLEEALFGLLFGADATLLESPVILCGLPDGQLCCVVLRALVTSRSAPGNPKALVRILHHLEEPVVFIGALRTEPQTEEAVESELSSEEVHSDCLVALGHHGRTLAIKASWDESGTLVPELQEYCLPGPVLCAACGGGGRIYHSTPSDLCVVDLAQGGTPLDPQQPNRAPGSLPPTLCPASLSICSVLTISVSPRAPAGRSGCSSVQSQSCQGPSWHSPCGWPTLFPGFLQRLHWQVQAFPLQPQPAGMGPRSSCVCLLPGLEQGHCCAWVGYHPSLEWPLSMWPPVASAGALLAAGLRSGGACTRLLRAGTRSASLHVLVGCSAEGRALELGVF